MKEKLVFSCMFWYTPYLRLIIFICPLIQGHPSIGSSASRHIRWGSCLSAISKQMCNGRCLDCTSKAELSWKGKIIYKNGHFSFSTHKVGQSSFHNFEANVQREMPRLHKQGRVVVERRDIIQKWPPQL
jgi:hypothetical protein